MRTFYILLFVICYQSIYSQIDTAKINKDLSFLTSDSLIDDFWGKMYASDQDLKTFNNPSQQIENLVKSILFFKKFGFSNYNRFSINTISYSNAEMNTLYIWMHSRYSDLNRCCVSLLKECCKIYTYGDEFNSGYFLQNLIFVCDRESERYYLGVKNEISKLEFIDVNINKIIDLANEYILFQKNIDNHKAILIGSWKNDLNVSASLKIFQSENNFFIQDLGWNFHKLKPRFMSLKKRKFSISNNEIKVKILKNNKLLVKTKYDKVLYCNIISQ